MLDISSPTKFMESLREQARTITDADFHSMHDLSSSAGDASSDPRSGNWGAVPTCVEVAKKNGVVAVRNSNDPDKVLALFSEMEWDIFIAGVKAGKFG